MNRVMLRGIQCYGCRSHVIQSFLAIADITFPAPLYHKPFTRSQPQHQSSFSSLQGQAAQGPPPTQGVPSKDASESNPNEQPPDSAGQSGEHVPWYLKEESAESAPHPLRQKQHIPPLPDNPPPILEDLLHHISVDIGLDDLSLLDLRSRNPPPALGANLIMIIGTARSIKHLNVAADRLCRWLRNTHNLHPTADGLLGRNELKIKLRRKARRAKLSNAVTSSVEEKDDGITTGWICVNVGSVDNGPTPATTQKRDVAGFGNVNEGARIVVQMLTEEKRAQLDLEGLWSGNFPPRSVSELKAFEQQFEAFAGKPPPDISGKLTVHDPRVAPGMLPGMDPGQRRGLHTGRRVQNISIEATVVGTGFMPRQGTPEPPPGQGLPPPDDPLGPTPPKGSKLKPLTLSPETVSLLQHLTKLPRNEAFRELGTGPQDNSSTLFLRLYKQAQADASPAFRDSHILAKLELIRVAVIIKHPRYTKQDLFDAFKALTSSAYNVSENQAMRTVKALLSFVEGDKDLAAAAKRVQKPDIDLALIILNHMSLRGMDILSRDIFSLLYSASGFQAPVRVANGNIGPHSIETETSLAVALADCAEANTVQDRLRKIMDAFDVKFGPDQFLNLLRYHFHHGNFDLFWSIWRKMSLLQLPRTKEFYGLLFQLHAARGNQKNAADCLSSWIPMMAREDPPVKVDLELAKGIMSCLLVANPDIKERAERGDPGEYPNLWIKCRNVVEAVEPAGAAKQIQQ